MARVYKNPGPAENKMEQPVAETKTNAAAEKPQKKVAKRKEMGGK